MDEVLDDVAARLGCTAGERGDEAAGRPVWFHRTVTAAPRVPAAGPRAAARPWRRSCRGGGRPHDDEEPVVAATTTTTTDPTATTDHPAHRGAAATDLATPKGGCPLRRPRRQIGTVGFWYGYPMTMPIVQEAGASGCGS